MISRDRYHGRWREDDGGLCIGWLPREKKEDGCSVDLEKKGLSRPIRLKISSEMTEGLCAVPGLSGPMNAMKTVGLVVGVVSQL